MSHYHTEVNLPPTPASATPSTVYIWHKDIQETHNGFQRRVASFDDDQAQTQRMQRVLVSHGLSALLGIRNHRLTQSTEQPMVVVHTPIPEAYYVTLDETGATMVMPNEHASPSTAAIHTFQDAVAAILEHMGLYVPEDTQQAILGTPTIPLRITWATHTPCSRAAEEAGFQTLPATAGWSRTGAVKPMPNPRIHESEPTARISHEENERLLNDTSRVV